jgi:hypothetical protein
MNSPDLNISLISHTNVGKTTLARTLLRRDVGEVFDQAHVTDLAEAHTLIRAAGGETLTLWDTPGFGDSFRIWKRLRQSDNAIVGFLTRLWDRFTDRPFWCSQQAILNVRDHAEVVLYLANAAEDPDEAAYIRPEIEILQWLRKPILVLLNQTGPPRDPAVEAAEIDRWRGHFAGFAVGSEVIAFDAFARCWVQEEKLWNKIHDLLPEERRPVMRVCLEHARRENVDRFQSAMRRLGAALTEISRDVEPLDQNLAEKLLGPLSENFREPQRKAMARLGERMVLALTAAVGDVVELYDLDGEAARVIEERFENDFAVRQPVNSGVAGTIGGFLSGALTGLAADLMAGGLTFGGGALIGGLLGATGGVLAAKSVNLIRGDRGASVAWSPRFVAGILESSLLRYLAVAHFGRGRGRWTESEHPRYWKDTVSDVIRERSGEIEAAVVEVRRDEKGKAMETLLTKATAEVLRRLYPEPLPEEGERPTTS